VVSLTAPELPQHGGQAEQLGFLLHFFLASVDVERVQLGFHVLRGPPHAPQRFPPPGPRLEPRLQFLAFPFIVREERVVFASHPDGLDDAFDQGLLPSQRSEFAGAGERREGGREGGRERVREGEGTGGGETLTAPDQGRGVKEWGP